MNPTEIEPDIRSLETMVPPSSLTMSFVQPTPEPSSLVSLGRLMTLLNEKWPIDRTIGNFQGNHSIVFDTTGLSVGLPCLVVSIWVWKQLDWRCYPVGLSEDDLRLTPEALIQEISRVLEPELSKIIAPRASQAPA